MKIVFLDVKTIGEDIDLSGYEQLGEVVRYPFSAPGEIPARAEDADVLVLNKPRIDEEAIRGALKLKLVCVTGTGTNNLDKDYLKSRNIAWRNVAGYSTESVAQHTFAMLFYLLEKLSFYDDYVKENRYTGDTSFTHFEEHFHELNGKTWGIIGLGNIGRRVASIAEAFGSRVIYSSPSGSAPQPGYRQTDMDTLLASSDIISVHAPLNRHTEDLIGAEAFRRMKSSCIFLNLGRGAIVDEQALAQALIHDEIAAAGLDVLREEPIRPDHPLLGIRDSKKLLITPHVAWASVESRTRLMGIVLEQIREFFAGSAHLP
ncbi:MAG: D-2-hydroxyacid dehydrogenase [Lachnospiraceae bacterium]|nr:D-2-hydroxyacid dehydrogenase [Lachnospiraceae bacterium]